MGSIAIWLEALSYHDLFCALSRLFTFSGSFLFIEAPLAVCVSTFLFVDLLTWELGQVFLLQFYREPLRRFNCSSGTIEKNELQSR